MHSREWIDMLRLIPTDQHVQLVVVTNNGVELSIELLIRADPNCLIFRGRVCGQSDDGRLFFVPYDQITFITLNRSVKEDEIREIFGPAVGFDENDLLEQSRAESASPRGPESPSDLTAAFLPSPTTPTPTPPPLSIVRQPPPPSMIIPPTPRPVPPPHVPLPAPDAANGKGSILEKLRAQRNAMKGPSR